MKWGDRRLRDETMDNLWRPHRRRELLGRINWFQNPGARVAAELARGLLPNRPRKSMAAVGTSQMRPCSRQIPRASSAAAGEEGVIGCYFASRRRAAGKSMNPLMRRRGVIWSVKNRLICQGRCLAIVSLSSVRNHPHPNPPNPLPEYRARGPEGCAGLSSREARWPAAAINQQSSPSVPDI